MSEHDDRDQSEQQAAESAARLFGTVLLTSIARDPNRLRWALATIDAVRVAVAEAAAVVAIEPDTPRH